MFFCSLLIKIKIMNMKKLKFYAYGLLVAGILFSAGCNKDSDDDNGDTPSGQSDYRVIESISYENNVEDYKAEFTYDGEQLSTVLEYVTFAKDQWSLDAKTEITYSGNNSYEMVYSVYDDGSWELDSRDVINHQDGLWQDHMEYFHDGADWISAYKTDYTYNSGKIVKEEYFEYVDGEPINDMKTIYSWVGDSPSAAEHYSWEIDEWIAETKDTITISDGKVIKVEMFMYEMNDYVFKMEFQYVGDVVSSIVMYYNLMGTWTNAGSILFTYDEHGNMIEEEITGEFSYRETYTYEEEKGNISLFYVNTGWYEMPYIGKSGSKTPLNFKDIKKHFSSFIN